METQKWIVVNFSGGKDSTAMLLRMMELGEHIDEVVWCDTYKEFPAMYEHIEKVKNIVAAAGVKFTTLKAEKDFDYYMFEHKVKPRKATNKNTDGYGWAYSRNRWCTDRLKTQVIDKYFRELRKERSIIRCIGLAADEVKRLERGNSQSVDHRYPLVEWGWSEKDCLKYCYDNGYDWGGLYEIFQRASCWCCPLQPIAELRKLRKHFPELWRELQEMDKKTWSAFKYGQSVEQLEKRFAFEEERNAQGLSITDREFFRELKSRL